MIDYVIGTPRLLGQTKEFEVCDFDAVFSDKHCIIHFTIEINRAIIPQGQVAAARCLETNPAPLPKRWVNEKRCEYIRKNGERPNEESR